MKKIFILTITLLFFFSQFTFSQKEEVNKNKSYTKKEILSQGINDLPSEEKIVENTFTNIGQKGNSFSFENYYLRTLHLSNPKNKNWKKKEWQIYFKEKNKYFFVMNVVDFEDVKKWKELRFMITRMFGSADESFLLLVRNYKNKDIYQDKLVYLLKRTDRKNKNIYKIKFPTKKQIFSNIIKKQNYLQKNKQNIVPLKENDMYKVYFVIGTNNVFFDKSICLNSSYYDNINYRKAGGRIFYSSLDLEFKINKKNNKTNYHFNPEFGYYLEIGRAHV